MQAHHCQNNPLRRHLNNRFSSTKETATERDGDIGADRQDQFGPLLRPRNTCKPNANIRRDSDSDKDMIEEVRSKELRAAPSSSSTAKREAEASSSSNAKREAEVSEPSNLEQHWKKTRTTGKGVEMISKIGYLLDEESQKHSDRVGFLQVRLVGPKATNRKPKVQRKKDGDNTLRFFRLQY